MLRIILTLYFIFGTEKDDEIRLDGNRLCIFTDMEEENLTISILDLEEKSKENLILKFQKNLLNLSTESKSRLYALNLPDKDGGIICFECKKEKSEGHLKSYLYFKTEEENFKTVYILERPRNVLKKNTNTKSRKKKNGFDVASFTYVRGLSGNNYVLTISKSFEDKCNLDMEIEMRQIDFFITESNNLGESLFKCSEILKINHVFTHKFKDMFKKYLNGLLFRAAYFRSLLSIYEPLNKEEQVMCNQIRFFSINMIKDSIYEVFKSYYYKNDLFEHKNMISKSEFDNSKSSSNAYKILHRNIKNAFLIEFKKEIEKLKEGLNALKEFFIEKFRIEKNYVEKRFNLCFKSIQVEKEKNLVSNNDLCVERSKKFQQAFKAFKVIYVSFISNLNKKYFNVTLNGETNKFEFSEWYINVVKKSESYYYYFLKNRASQIFDSFECSIPSFVGDKSKDFNVSNIYEDIAKFKREIDELKPLYDQNDNYLIQLFEEVSTNTVEMKFWEDVNKDLNGGLNKDQKGGKDQVEKKEE